MADWSANGRLENGCDGYQCHRQNSVSSEQENIRMLTLSEGHRLAEESRTEHARISLGLKTNNKFVPDIPARQPLNNKMKHAPAPPTTSPTTTDSNGVSQADIEIPNDGCLFNFTADEMSSFFRHLSVNERLVKHLHSKNVDGKRFSKFKDTDLETLGIRNPVVTYFRDKSVKKVKPKMDFIL